MAALNSIKEVDEEADISHSNHNPELERCLDENYGIPLTTFRTNEFKRNFFLGSDDEISYRSSSDIDFLRESILAQTERDVIPKEEVRKFRLHLCLGVIAGITILALYVVLLLYLVDYSKS